ncbi:hypothetical protein PV387_36295 [Streptomyces sp. ME02-6987-2C]|uniref:hypothetical protein n=1 Tax=unclassified Streptomyces TaxID=2593676 RepID=UPI0029B465AA|nr:MULTISPECIES: hypothetical protein [unclassified Streptomyces]MDX3345946.1 hypothetical protein [Streptomyces sp. ME02-6979A]MDX3371402.1 hypothetical protein [Streptomyces sp. ME02-6987-2C]MDX3411621.1 hypothetical protein [Streptomyces sp. ME02-6977A]MDX3421712.1 hypothetical protein [Streptomyces sp. ME02-6985-2c]
MTETPDQQPRIPGVRYKTETRTRQVPSQVFGDEVMDEEQYTVDVPVPPRDWDRAAMLFLLAVAFGGTAVAVVWSTASISKLLLLLGTQPEIAIAAASSFELLWIVCLVAEHLLRGQPDRARPLKKAGWIAVWFVVGAVVAQGVHAHEVAAGIFGGMVSLMAKGAWWVVFWVRQPKLRRPIAVWLQRKMEDTAAAEALLAFKQRIGDRQAYAALVYGEDEFAAAQDAVRASGRVQGIPAAPARQPAPVAQSAPPVPPVQQPAPVGTAADTSGTASGEHPDASGSETLRPEAGPSPILPMAPSIRQIVAKALDEDVEMPFEDLLKKVQDVHGDRPKLAGTVERYQRMELKLRKAS